MSEDGELEARIVRKMLDILRLKRAVCGSDKDCKFTTFRNKLLAAFPAAERPKVDSELFFLKNSDPFRMSEDGLSICYRSSADRAATTPSVINSIAAETGLNKSQVDAVLDSLASQIWEALRPGGPGKFVFSNLFKIEANRDADSPEDAVVLKSFKKLRDMPKT